MVKMKSGDWGRADISGERKVGEVKCRRGARKEARRGEKE